MGSKKPCVVFCMVELTLVPAGECLIYGEIEAGDCLIVDAWLLFVPAPVSFDPAIASFVLTFVLTPLLFSLKGPSIIFATISLGKDDLA